ncbi:MAG: hypothetical protein WCA35_09770 [Kovacikia sp.]
MNKTSLSTSDKWLMLYILAFIGTGICFSFLVIKNFSSPLSGMTGLGPQLGVNHDFVDVQEYKGFYLAKNLHFNPFPHVDLVTNQVFYPYGVNSVFTPWSDEADLFYAALYSLWGAGPWLQSYYLLTVLITAVGAFFLLKRDYGSARALGAGFLLSFGNFYAVNKYSHHLTLAIVHWLTLGLIADFLITKRVVLRKDLSLKLILVRSGLLLLLFSHELGYIAGLGLMSFTVTILFMGGLICYRYVRGEFKLLESLSRVILAWRDEFLAYPRIGVALLGLNIFAAYLYLPFTLQIVGEARQFNLTETNISVLWANPLRVFLPLFPVISKPEMSLEEVFHDSSETIFDGRPGWFLLILGGMGLWQNRHRMTIFMPLLITFALCLLYIPGELFVDLTLKELGLLTASVLGLWLVRNRLGMVILLLAILVWGLCLNPTLFLVPTLKLFPWFMFNRTGGRCTLIYPAILCIFALHINFSQLSLYKRQVVTGFLVILACVEFGTVYSLRSSYQQPEPLSQDFFAYMNYVKQQPGEAVLDWPFCIVSGGGADNLCPYYFYNSGISSLRRFHEKKVMGHYFGRLHPSQVAPYFQAGWDRLFFPDDQMPSRQSRCFTAAEWSFFTDFFKLNDFAGINLYVDRLPERCISDFSNRFGAFTAETWVPGAGRVKFIPKSLELRNQVNLALGSSLKLKE